MRRLRITPPLVMALGLVLVLLPGTAGAVEPEAAGWWSRTSTPVGVNPAAPTAGEDQLVVQGEPSGANAIAALRWTLPEGASGPTLTITAAEGSVVPAEALILACKAGSPWTEAKGAPLEEAPKVDCGTSVNGVVAEDGTITFALGTLMNGQVLDVVLTPGKMPDDTGSTFLLTFDRPGADALVTSAGGGDETAFDSGSAGGGAFAPSSSGSGSFAAPSASGGDTSFSAPSTGAAAPTTPAAEAALPPENQVALDTATGAAEPAAASDDRDRAKTLGIAVLLVGAAVAAWAFMSGGAGRVGAGAGAVPAVAATAPTPGGLGRFVRPRVGPPPSLS